MGVFNSESLHAETASQSTDSDQLVTAKLLELSEQRRQIIQAAEKKESSNSMPSLLALEVKIPSSSSVTEFLVEEEDRDSNSCGGLKTPTSLDQRIPFSLPCPPAPRKPRPLPLSKKRKAAPSEMTLLNLSNEEVESLFPPALDVNFGRKIKKVRRMNYFI